MSNNMAGILLGGILPAVMYGLFPVLVKSGNAHGLTPGAMLLCVGAAVTAIGGVYLPVVDRGFGAVSFTGTAFGLAAGFAWGLGALGVGYAISALNAPVALITPIFNTNSLVAVVLGLVVFSEWKTLQVPPLLLGTLLIVIGGIVISRA